MDNTIMSGCAIFAACVQIRVTAFGVLPIAFRVLGYTDLDFHCGQQICLRRRLLAPTRQKGPSGTDVPTAVSGL